LAKKLLAETALPGSLRCAFHGLPKQVGHRAVHLDGQVLEPGMELFRQIVQGAQGLPELFGAETVVGRASAQLPSV